LYTSNRYLFITSTACISNGDISVGDVKEYLSRRRRQEWKLTLRSGI